jgi:Tfp pilus assembly PilM family ATPase
MRMLTQREYEVTQEKLADLQRWYAEAQERQSENSYTKELTLRSLGRLIKQLKEEIIWYECHSGLRKCGNPTMPSIPHSGETSSPCTN